jgi:hypothetical protein
MFREPFDSNAPRPEPTPLSAEDDFSDEGADPLWEWLACYVPSWGTSVLFHVALILLAAVVVIDTYGEARRPDTVIEGRLLPDRRPVAERPEGGMPGDPGHPTWEKRLPDARPLEQKAPELPSITTLADTTFLASFSLEDGKDLIYVPGFPDGDRIFGNQGPGGDGRDDTHGGAERIVYVVDKSGSMTDSIAIVKRELKRSLRELPRGRAFHIIFYSSGPPLEMSARRLVDATDRNVGMAEEFIDKVVAGGQTDPSEALERAFAARPDLIYLLTDGEFDREIVGLVERLSASRRVRVDTIAFLYRTGEGVLKEIARGTGGKYKFVSERDLAHLGG